MNRQSTKSEVLPSQTVKGKSEHRKQKQDSEALEWDLMTEDQQKDILDHLSDMPFQ